MAKKRSRESAGLDNKSSEAKQISIPTENSEESDISTPSSSRKFAFKDPVYQQRLFQPGTAKPRVLKNLKQVITAERLYPNAVTYASIEALTSVRPLKKYSDISGLPAKYVDPQTKLRYANVEEFTKIRSLTPEQVNGYLVLRRASIPMAYLSSKRKIVDGAEAVSTDSTDTKPKTKGRPVTNPPQISLADANLAVSAVQHISKFCPKSRFIFDASPGPALLARELLKAGYEHVRAFEKCATIRPVLKKLKSKYSNQFEVYTDDELLRLPTVATADVAGRTRRVDKMLQGVPIVSWEEPPPVAIVASLSRSQELRFLRYLNHAISRQINIFSIGRPQFFLFISKQEYEYMISERSNLKKGKGKGLSIFYHLFFDTKLLEICPRNAFIPQVSESSASQKEDNRLYFVLMEPRTDLMSLVDKDLDRLWELSFFIRQNMMRLKAYVIPTLERWIPGSGVPMVLAGFNVFTKFNDLDASQMVDIFRKFSSLPGYDESPFRIACRRERDVIVTSDDEVGVTVVKSE